MAVVQNKKRDPETGEYILKSEEHREIKTVRVTNTTWEKFRQVAASFGMSRADLIEQIALGGVSMSFATSPDDSDLSPD